MSLVLVKPVTITDAMLTATDVAEADYGVYNAATAYGLADRVIVTTGVHKVYESLQAANTGHDPTLAASAAWWIEVGPTNRWKLFDTSNSTQTTQAAAAYYEITPGVPVNAVAALNVSADSVRIRLTDPTDGVVYDETTSLLGTIPAPSWLDYFFGSVSPEDQVIALDLPPYASAVLRVDFASASGNVACGVLLMGYQLSFGDGIEYGARAGIHDYSRKETNAWGDTVLDQRAYAKRAEWAMPVANTEIDALLRALVAVRATPCLWVGYAAYSLTTVFGFYKDFDITISYPTYSDCTLTIEGMT